MGEKSRSVCQDTSSSAAPFAVSAVFGSGAGSVLLAQAWLKIACISGLVVPVPLLGVGFVWLSGVWLNGLSALGRF